MGNGAFGGHSTNAKYAKKPQIITMDQSIQVPGQKKVNIKQQEIRYGGGIISLSPDGTKLFWQRDKDNPKVCVELLIGCMVLILKRMESVGEDNPFMDVDLKREVLDDWIHKIKLALSAIKIQQDTEPGLPAEDLVNEEKKEGAE